MRLQVSATWPWLDNRFLGQTGEDKSNGNADTGLRVAGMKICRSNNLPDQDESGD